MRRWLVLLLFCGCSPPDEVLVDPGLVGLALLEAHPAIVLPGTPLDLVGMRFVDEAGGLSSAQIRGEFTAEGGASRAIDTTLPAGYVDSTHLRVAPATRDLFTALGGMPGRFHGLVSLGVDSSIDFTTHRTGTVPLDVELVASLTPRLDRLEGGTLFVNQDITLEGQNFLLGAGEGETRALLDGCFLPEGGREPCAPAPKGQGRAVNGVEIAARPAEPWSRTRASFPFGPQVGGIHPGTFTGTVRLRNIFPGSPAVIIAGQPLRVTLKKPDITRFNPLAASLGQYVEISGGGFVGDTPGAVTLLKLAGEFAVEGTPVVRPVDLVLLPRFVAGDHLRYVLDEADQLGRAVPLRQIAGTFKGTAQPIVLYGGEQEVGPARPVSLGIAHVKQIVYLDFHASFSQSLRRFGLNAGEEAIRARVFEVTRRDYTGANVEFREQPPDDFALYAQVDILGPDPNNLGLLGYDNTPGKDTNNSRLFDRIGGVNATTQEDGFPGYGGVFSEQFLGFSRFPPPQVAKLPIEATDFDAIFDPLRPDRNGIAATLAEVRTAAVLSDGSRCPSTDRQTQVACAVFVLGNLIGTTLSHETGHSLGLANPFGDGFHTPGDLPNRLMESGGDRPFEERAELRGKGPAVFCDMEFAYLKMILPAPGGDKPRPECGP